MAKHSIRFDFKRIKNIPKTILILWIVSVILFLYSIVELVLPKYRTLDNLQEIEIKIDEVYLWDSYNLRGSRMKLVIVSEGVTYYLWYPKSHYQDFSGEIERDLLSGDMSSVTVKVVDSPSLWDRLFNEKRMVDVRSDSATYYDLDTEKIAIEQNRISAWTLFLVMLIWLVIITPILLLAYGVLNFRRV